MDVVTAPRLVVDRATILEWFQIEALRRGHFEPRGEPVQRRGEGVSWYVAREGERVLGCYSTQDADGFRWVLDFYRVADKRGRYAVKAMLDAIRADAAADRLRVGFTVAPDNDPMLATAAKRFTPVGVIFLGPEVR